MAESKKYHKGRIGGKKALEIQGGNIDVARGLEAKLRGLGGEAERSST